jgi:pilus assembly protein Flp/PilA
MRSVIDAVTSLAREEEGAALVEYGMLVLLIAVLCIVAIQGIGQKVSNGFDKVNTTLP